MFSRPVSSPWKPVPTSSRLPTRPRVVAPHQPGGPVGDRVAQRVVASLELAEAVALREAVDLDDDRGHLNGVREAGLGAPEEGEPEREEGSRREDAERDELRRRRRRP